MVERDRLGSYDEAAEAFDRLSAGSDRRLRIRQLDPRTRPVVIGAILGALLVLAGIAWFVYVLTD